MKSRVPALIDDLGPVRKVERWHFPLAALLAGGLLAHVMIFAWASLTTSFPNRPPRWSIAVAIAVLEGGVLAGILLSRHARLKSLAAQARMHRGLLCRRCMYPASQSRPVCPECGFEQDMTQTASDWNAFAARHLGELPAPPPASPADGVTQLLPGYRHWGD